MIFSIDCMPTIITYFHDIIIIFTSRARFLRQVWITLRIKINEEIILVAL